VIIYNGKYTNAVVYVDSIESKCASQIMGFLNHPVFTNPVKIMPDTHYGSGSVIGFTMELTDKIIPNTIGVDIGCGMLSTFFSEKFFHRYERDEIDERVREAIPVNYNKHKRDTFDFEKWFLWFSLNEELRRFTLAYNAKFDTRHSPISYDYDWFKKKCEQLDTDYIEVERSVGTLGGGNHFIEFDIGSNGEESITVHSGSRNFGLRIAKHWQHIAKKKEGKMGGLEYLTGDDMYGYLVDMLFAQAYADRNRFMIMSLILKSLNDHDYKVPYVKEEIKTVHNYVDFRDFIIRKGAISSYEGEKMVIPWNMEDGILLCSGKSNPDWNYSAPHGAGRLFSRGDAKKKLNVPEARSRMKNKNIYASVLPKDELKGAYKDHKVIEDAIGPTAVKIDTLKPYIVIKGKG
jgi:tRNA-splicing ligase RtcB (3'-phosphate/5'-hydroxy nucleic acid ligase)